MTISDLESKANESLQNLQRHYDEQKHNILLDSGEHYAKLSQKYLERGRTAKVGNAAISGENRIRITKNYIYKIMKIFVNNITSYCPGTTIIPTIEEAHAIVDADLCRSVWEDIKYEYKINAKIRKGVEHFCKLGEWFLKVWWDYAAGDIVGYEAAVDEVTGEPLVDPSTGQQVPDKNKPVFEGGYIFDIVPGYDVFHDPSATSLDESQFIGIKKLVPMKDLEQLVDNDPYFTEEEKEEKKKAIKESASDKYSVFNGINANLTYSAEKALVKEYYFRPCAEYPMGYFYYTVKTAILWEGELQKTKEGKPIFPILYALCDEFQGSARGYSPIRQGRPMQAEVNRAGSKIAETQITLGDDKIVTLMGANITEGEKLGGIRQVKLPSAGQFTVIPGRSGEQYVGYMEKCTAEEFSIMGTQEDSQEKLQGADMVQTLYRSLRDKKKFTYYSDKIERFLVDWTDLAIKLAKANYRDDKIVQAVGKIDAINIEEFKNTKDTTYQIKVEPLSDDIESMMGKYMVFTNTLQYTKMDEITIGKIMEQMPFINGKEIFGHLTLDYKEARNICLALDRGEYPMVTQFDNNEYIVKYMTTRMRESDYIFMVNKNPKILEAYEKQYFERTQKINEKAEQLKQVNMGIIPTGGAQIKVDAYMPDPSNPMKTMRATLPQASFEWLMKRLGEQGAMMSEVEKMPDQAQIDVLGQKKPNLSIINGQTSPQGGM